MDKEQYKIYKMSPYEWLETHTLANFWSKHSQNNYPNPSIWITESDLYKVNYKKGDFVSIIILGQQDQKLQYNNKHIKLAVLKKTKINARELANKIRASRISDMFLTNSNPTHEEKKKELPTHLNLPHKGKKISKQDSTDKNNPSKSRYPNLLMNSVVVFILVVLGYMLFVNNSTEEVLTLKKVRRRIFK